MRPGIIVASAAAAWTVPAIAPHAPAVAAGLGIELRLADVDGIALTFDDGPHRFGTPAVLRELERAGAIATFFLVGEQVRRDPGLAREIIAAGHALGLHGDRHRNQLRLGPRALADDLARVAATVAEATGRAPRVYRPPYGVFSAAGLALVRRRALRPLLWSRWGRDWRRRARPARIAALASRDLAAGDVVLLHDADTYSAPGSWRRTAAALPALLDVVGRAGLATVAVPGRGQPPESAARRS
jgi:peptidoglycan-N-acetylglucosamine deacetylase